MRTVFGDSAYFIGLLSERDALHSRAMRLAQTPRMSIVTTRWILTEVCDGFAASLQRAEVGRYVQRLDGMLNLRIVPATEALFTRGLEHYASRADKMWSLTDCISFVVMAEHGLTEALTSDHHFEQAGFVALLK